MTRIAITGHRGLSDKVEVLVDLALRKELTRHADGLVGISCLADGADQLFARAVLDLGGELEAVDRQGVEPGGIDEPHLGGLVAHGDLLASDLAKKELLNSWRT